MKANKTMTAYARMDDEPLRLADAAALAFPDGSMTASGLRREATKGRLRIRRNGNALYTTMADVRAMIELCRVGPRQDGTIGFVHQAPAEIAAANADALNSMRTVYFIRCMNRVKIGVANDVTARISQIATSAAYQPELLFHMPGTEADEKELHARFAAYRAHREWFEIAGELESFLIEKGAKL